MLLAGGGNNVISGSSAATLTNANNTIVGTGDIVGLNLVNSGTINGNVSAQIDALVIDVAGVLNAGLMEGTATSALVFQGTPTISNTSKGVILASGNNANVVLNSVAVYGGTLKTSAGGEILFNGAGNVFSGGTIAAGSLVGISNNASLAISGIINNSGVLDVDPPAIGSGVLLIGSSSATLQGGGNVRMDALNAFIEAVSGGNATLINVNNTISGAGMIGVGDGHLTLVNRGTVNADSPVASLTIDTGSTVVNSGTLEATSSGSLVIDDRVTNSKVIEALGSGAVVTIGHGSVVSNTTASAVIVASGKGARVELNGVTVSGGLVEATSGSTAIVSGGTVGAGATVETFVGGTAFVSGTVVNSGKLFASGTGSLLEIESGAVVSGGAVVVGNGIVNVLSGGSADVAFLSNGSGGLEIADAGLLDTAVFAGTVSGFGGVNHTNHKQFIDLVSVTSNSSVSASYTSTGPNAGVLTVTSGIGILSATVAQINFSGQYVTSNFHVTSGHGGVVEIVDPTVPNGGSVAPGPGQNFPAAGHRSAEYRLRRADDARLFGERRRNRRHLDGKRRPPRREHRAPRQLHGGKLRCRGRRPRRHAGHRFAAGAAAAAGASAPDLNGGGLTAGSAREPLPRGFAGTLFPRIPARAVPRLRRVNGRRRHDISRNLPSVRPRRKVPPDRKLK